MNRQTHIFLLSLLVLSAAFFSFPGAALAQLEDWEPAIENAVEAVENAIDNAVPLAPGVTGRGMPVPPGYTPLAPLPGPGGTAEAGSYFNYIIQITIGLAGILAVLMIVIGGAEYMGSEAFTSKEAGIKKMQGAIWGLLLAIGAWLILNTINPDLLRIEFGFIKNIAVPKTTTSAPSPGTQTETAPKEAPPEAEEEEDEN